MDGLEMLHVPAWSDRGTAVLTDQADLSWNVPFETWEEGETRSGYCPSKLLANFGAYLDALQLRSVNPLTIHWCGAPSI